MKTLVRAIVPLAAAAALCTLAACDRGSDRTISAKPDPSAQTIDVKPAPPTGDPPGTTPVTGNESNLSEAQKQTQMPLEGQNHSYSSVAPTQSQKPGDGHSPSEGDNARGDSAQQGAPSQAQPRSQP